MLYYFTTGSDAYFTQIFWCIWRYNSMNLSIFLSPKVAKIDSPKSWKGQEVWLVYILHTVTFLKWSSRNLPIITLHYTLSSDMIGSKFNIYKSQLHSDNSLTKNDFSKSKTYFCFQISFKEINIFIILIWYILREEIQFSLKKFWN